jgi:FkbM family methyltransferase
MTEPAFVSFAQNGEDVVLWRALHGVAHGRYVDVGANHPRVDSVSRAFYERGWSGITVEPDPFYMELQRDERPRDIQIEAAITARDRDEITFYVVDQTGLSTLDADLASLHASEGFTTHEVKIATRRIDSVLDEAGWRDLDVHFMLIDTEGAERQVLESFDLRVWRPWVLVVEATVPNSTASTQGEWEEIVLQAGYRFSMFDGLSCFYVAEEREASLGRALSYGACVLDDFERFDRLELKAQARAAEDLVEQVAIWRAETVDHSLAALTASAHSEAAGREVERLREELSLLETRYERELRSKQREIDDLRGSTSWQLTGPLRRLSGSLHHRPNE